MPLLSLKDKVNDTAENTKPTAAAASPSTSQTTTPAVAKVAPRKVASKPFILNVQAFIMLQSIEFQNPEEKEALLKNAARAVELKIGYPRTWTPEANQVIAPLTNVRSLFISAATANDLPLLPCPEKLGSLTFGHNAFQTIQNIAHYTNLHTLRLSNKSLSVTNQDPNKTDRLAVLTQLHNLRTLHCGTLFTLDHKAPDERALLIRILGSNSEIQDFTCAGGVATDVVQALATLPLRRLLLMNGEIDDEKFARLPFNTLEELRFYGRHTLTDLTPLRDSALRVFHLHNQENLNDTLPQVICSMPHLEELDLRFCRLTDAQAKPLLQLSQRLRQLKLGGGRPRLSTEMCQRLKAAFGDKVSLETRP